MAFHAQKKKRALHAPFSTTVYASDVSSTSFQTMPAATKSVTSSAMYSPTVAPPSATRPRSLAAAQDAGECAALSNRARHSRCTLDGSRQDARRWCR